LLSGPNSLRTAGYSQLHQRTYPSPRVSSSSDRASISFFPIPVASQLHSDSLCQLRMYVYNQSADRAVLTMCCLL
jgi:hypothetical protein